MVRTVSLPEIDTIAQAFEIIEQQKQLLFRIDEAVGKILALNNSGSDVDSTPLESFSANFVNNYNIIAERVEDDRIQAQRIIDENIDNVNQIRRLEAENSLLRSIIFEQMIKHIEFDQQMKSDVFCDAYYLSNNLDVAQAVEGHHFKSGFEHWMLYGIFERRLAAIREGALDWKALSEQFSRRYGEIRKAWRKTLRRTGLRMIIQSFRN